ncbi:DUF979 domain-containing protein [Vulcaniibacterium tengchongense]|uniref:Putative membrane protein n=1 Tax=Vulcaniibacterium tengchongense TaxID=1273429 RepID=A0A3N4VWE4_9GAMM|nr:DUF979 family protein [Vulcaniibacterium tengchongense]RPE81377.1 putative membrane protein [Vulcaniibacterium tengchongense]
MIGLAFVYWLLGAYLAALAWRGLRDRGNPRRHTTALFWGLLAALLFAAEQLPARLVGAAVVLLAALAGFGGLRMGRYDESGAEEKRSEARRLGNRLFRPALLIPAVTLLGALGLQHLRIGGTPLLDPANVTLVSLALACLVALAAACRLTRQTPWSAVEQSRRLVDAIGWAALLPLLLATLGSVFEAGGVGQAVAGVVRALIPVENPFAVVLAYALGMALFTVIMGNAFAAFPVMTAGIALPLLVRQHGAEPAALAAIGMLSGYCGTLMTPMAANFNLVPAALLELEDPYGVIRAQWLTGALLLLCNVLLMYWFAFR